MKRMFFIFLIPLLICHFLIGCAVTPKHPALANADLPELVPLRHFFVNKATKFAYKISPDGKKHTFYLRKGVKFHHGQELSAEDVKFSLERLLDRESHSPYYQFFLPRVLGARDFWDGKSQEVIGFKVIDRYTFEITWTKSFVSALDLMSMHFCKILPRDLVLDRGQGFFRNPSASSENLL